MATKLGYTVEVFDGKPGYGQTRYKHAKVVIHEIREHYLGVEQATLYCKAHRLRSSVWRSRLHWRSAGCRR